MSIYTKAKLGVEDNQILLNDDTSDPYYRVKARAPSRWQIRQQDIPLPFESGSSDFLSLIGQSAYTISGVMYPSDETHYDAGLNALRTVASLDIEQADIESDFGYVPYTWGDATGDYSKQVFIKPLYVQLAETTSQGYVQPFTIISKVKDPTIFGGTLKTATTLPADFTQTTGSAVFPIKFPLIFGATLFSVSSTAINNGTLPAFPQTIFVKGPVNKPIVTNQATGEFIEVDVNLSSVNDQLNINYDKGTVDINLNGTSVLRYLSQDSTLFQIHPGSNVITLTGSSVSSNAYATVEYYDAWPLS